MTTETFGATGGPTADPAELTRRARAVIRHSTLSQDSQYWRSRPSTCFVASSVPQSGQ